MDLHEKLAATWKWEGWRHVAMLDWNHLTIRCSAPDCHRHGKAQFAPLARFRGIFYNNGWYHATACLNTALVQQLRSLLLTFSQDRGKPYRLPLGLLLVNRGAITPQELRAALQLQQRAGYGKLGYWVRQIANLNESRLTAALGQQWGCPVFPLNQHTAAAHVPGCPPFPLLAAAKAVPAYSAFDGHLLHIAFSDHVDHTLLYALEEILGCRTVACVSTESSVNLALEMLRRHGSGDNICFDSVHDPFEIADTICNYAAHLGAKRLKVVRAGGYIWAALFRKELRRDLLFRAAPPQQFRCSDPGFANAKDFLSSADTRKDGVYDATGLP
jgi:hypothetical protein